MNTVDLFCENIILGHCSVVVYNDILPFFLFFCIKEHVVNFEFVSTVWLDKRDKAYKAQNHCIMYMFSGLHVMYHP